MAPRKGETAEQRAARQLQASEQSLIRYKRTEVMRVIKDDDHLVKDLYDTLQRKGVFDNAAAAMPALKDAPGSSESSTAACSGSSSMVMASKPADPLDRGMMSSVFDKPFLVSPLQKKAKTKKKKKEKVCVSRNLSKDPSPWKTEEALAKPQKKCQALLRNSQSRWAI